MTAGCYSTIRCPFCDHRQDYSDILHILVSYHGEDGPQELSCDSCGHDFYVDERVSRSYGVGKSREEAAIA